MLKKENQQLCVQAHSALKHSESCFMTPQKDDCSPTHDTVSTSTRYRVLKRCRDDSGSNSRERRFRTQPSGVQFMSLKKLEEIIKTVAEKNKADDKSEEVSLQSTCSKEGSRLATESVGSAAPTYRIIRSNVAAGGKIENNKTTESKLRPGTPKKDVSVEESAEQRRVRQLERVVRELEKKLQQKVRTQQEYQQLQRKYKAELERINKLLDRINTLSKDKDQAVEQAQNVRTQLNASRRVVTVSSRGESSEVAIKERENKRLNDEVARMREENSKLRDDIYKTRTENTRLIKLVKSFEDRLSEMQRCRQAHIGDLLRQHTEREKSLESTVQSLRSQLQAIEFQTICEIQQQLHNTTVDLNYYKVNSHCLKRQLEEAKVEMGKMIPPDTHSTLRKEYNRVLGKLRDAQGARGRKMNPNAPRDLRDQSFELTPQK